MTEMPDNRPLALIAGNGRLPLEIKTELDRLGQQVLLVGIEGEVEEKLAGLADAVFSFGQLGSLFSLFEKHGVKRLVLAGGVRKRPDFLRMKKDLTTLREVPRLLKIVMGGDNSVLSKIAAYFGERDIDLVGAHEIVPELLAPKGIIAGKKLPKGFEKGAQFAMEAAKTVGRLDAGQAVVVEGGRVIALEGAEGTDAMIQRVAELRRLARIKTDPESSILAKVMKPDQDIRADLPAIGPDTVEGCVSAGIKAIVVEAGRTFILEKERTLKDARDAGILIYGIKHAGINPA